MSCETICDSAASSWLYWPLFVDGYINLLDTLNGKAKPKDRSKTNRKGQTQRLRTSRSTINFMRTVRITIHSRTSTVRSMHKHGNIREQPKRWCLKKHYQDSQQDSHIPWWEPWMKCIWARFVRNRWPNNFIILRRISSNTRKRFGFPSLKIELF